MIIYFLLAIKALRSTFVSFLIICFFDYISKLYITDKQMNLNFKFICYILSYFSAVGVYFPFC